MGVRQLRVAINAGSPLLRRLSSVTTPVVPLTTDQQNALDRLRERLANGYYEFEEAVCVCGQRNGRLIAQRDRYALPVNTYLCRSCGVMWTDPRMTESSLSCFYQEDYRPVYVGREQAGDDFFAAQVQQGRLVHDFVVPHIGSVQHATVFDIGCGAGGVLVPFVEAGWTGVGCDLGGEYLQYGRAAGLVLLHGSVFALAEYGHANLAIASHVLEHLPDPLLSLKQMSQLLVHGGFVYIELPGIFSIHKTYGDILKYLQNAHLYHFTLGTLTSLMAQAGFRLVKGDQRIRALYRKDRSASPAFTGNQYRRIKAYLHFVELRRLALHARLRRVARRLVHRIAS